MVERVEWRERRGGPERERGKREKERELDR